MFCFFCVYTFKKTIKKIVDTICYHAHVQPFSGTALHCPRLHCVAVETNVDASHADIEIMIVEPPRHGGIIRSHSVDRHRFTMADVDDGSVTYEHAAAAAAAAGNRSDDDDFRFVVRVGAVESTGSVQVRVTDVVTSSSSTTSPAPPSLPRVVANVVATVDEMDAVALSAHLLEVTARSRFQQQSLKTCLEARTTCLENENPCLEKSGSVLQFLQAYLSLCSFT